jgi:hypothetical protein
MPIYANTTPQADRTISITLGTVTGATKIRPAGSLTIHDDD